MRVMEAWYYGCMHPLNPFPELLTYGLLAPTLIRFVLGFLFINLGFLKLRREKERWMIFAQSLKLTPPELWVKGMASLEIVGGAMLLAGYYTQWAALALLLFTLKELWVERTEDALVSRDIVFYILIATMLASLLFSGAGFLAFDLPL